MILPCLGISGSCSRITLSSLRAYSLLSRGIDGLEDHQEYVIPFTLSSTTFEHNSNRNHLQTKIVRISRLHMSGRNFTYIDNTNALELFCATLGDYPWLAIDTEFQREQSYFPKLCLLQIATPQGGVGVVDPFAIGDLSSLVNRLYDKHLTKVLHSARQDLEIFYHLTGAVPQPIFDTQVAASLLGFADQIGYASLVEQVLGIKLSKTQTRTDWTNRPLSREQIHYAVDDVHYLAHLYIQLRDRLDSLGRLAWLDEELLRLCAPDIYQTPPELAWQRFRVAERMHGSPLAALKRLAAWREVQAKALDRPRGWILRDEVLLDIAQQLPTTVADLARINGVHERLVQKHVEELLDMIGKAKKNPEARRSATDAERNWNIENDALADTLMAVVKLRALECQINPTVLATVKDIQKLISSAHDSMLTRGWRAEIVGNDLDAILAGQLCLRVSNRKLLTMQCAKIAGQNSVPTIPSGDV